MNTFPEIYKGQLYEIEGEIYELEEFRVTNVYSSTNFTTAAFFRSKEIKSQNPFFEEAIKRVIGNPIFKIHRKERKIGFRDWLKTVGKPSGRLKNILWRICDKGFNHRFADVSPLDITKTQFLQTTGAGIKSWEEFIKLRAATTT